MKKRVQLQKATNGFLVIAIDPKPELPVSEHEEIYVYPTWDEAIEFAKKFLEE